MKKNKGFTLIELLVVMAIIAILASIVVPNVQRYIVRARLTRAIAEISGMDLSLTAIVTDAGRGNLGQMLLKEAIPEMFNRAYGDTYTPPGWPTVLDNLDAFNYELFENAAQVYSRLAYDLLRLGRDCLRSDTDTIANFFIDPDVLAQIGTNYMDVGLDPWGGTYQIWPGPWRYSRENVPGGVGRWPIPFRIFTVETGTSTFAVQKDQFILTKADHDFFLSAVAADAETWPSVVSYPADGNKSVFIWSLGQNSRSSQMLYKAVYDQADPFDWFFTDSGEDIAGGDDVNNWDTGNSWQRFYM